MTLSYHVFKNPRYKNGQKFYVWNYYFLDENSKQIQKVCKFSDGTLCRSRCEAEDFIRTLPDIQVRAKTISDIAKNMVTVTVRR